VQAASVASGARASSTYYALSGDAPWRLKHAHDLHQESCPSSSTAANAAAMVEVGIPVGLENRLGPTGNAESPAPSITASNADDAACHSWHFMTVHSCIL